MPNYLRNRVFGGTFFFTLVSRDRNNFFANPNIINIFFDIIKKIQNRKPFELIAYCVLPDHIHLLIKLPEDSQDFSQIIRDIKRGTTIKVRKFLKLSDLIIWQDRFWEHTIQDDRDLQRHFDYIHYNPVKHGYAEDYAQWEWSSYYQFYDNSGDPEGIDPLSFERSGFSFGE